MHKWADTESPSAPLEGLEIPVPHPAALTHWLASPSPAFPRSGIQKCSAKGSAHTLKSRFQGLKWVGPWCWNACATHTSRQCRDSSVSRRHNKHLLYFLNEPSRRRRWSSYPISHGACCLGFFIFFKPFQGALQIFGEMSPVHFILFYFPFQ